MNFYVQMTDAEYELYKRFKEKPNLENHDSAELAAALLSVIKKEGGNVDTQDSLYDFNPNNRKATTVGKLRNANFIISLIVEKY